MAGKILVVDDEKEIADLMEVYLRNDGYAVYKAYIANDALQCIENTEIDLALLDVMLPDMDGFQLCRRIRERYFFPVIMLTAKVEDMDKIMGLTIGADDYITKPFNPLEVVARIKTQLRRYIRYNHAAAGRGSTLENRDAYKCATKKCENAAVGQNAVMADESAALERDTVIIGKSAASERDAAADGNNKAVPRSTATTVDVPLSEHDIRGLLINKDMHRCTLYGKEIPLTPIEFSILWYLCENQGRVIPSEELFEKVWGEKFLDNNNTVMAHIGRLREKLGEPARKPKFIKTVWGVGYIIE